MSEEDLYPKPGQLRHYVIYDHPKDHPAHYVVRPFVITPGFARPLEVCGLFYELEKARAFCAQFGLVRLGRHPDDDPVVVESWV